MSASRSSRWPVWAGHCAPFVLTAAMAALFFSGCGEKSQPNGPEKTTYTLTVTCGQGVDGHPNSGTYAYDSGQTANYGYRALEDYYNLSVTVDGSAVAAEGSVTMNADHRLAASCLQRVLWKYAFDPPVYHSSPAVGNDGTIYVGSGDSASLPGTLYAIGPAGTFKWSYQGESCLYSPVIGKDGTIFVQDFHNIVSALSPGGTLKWTWRDYAYFYPTNVGQRNPAIGADGTVYIAADGLYAVSPSTGRSLWHSAHPVYPARQCYASPVIGQDGTIYIVIEDTVFAVKPNGDKKWAFTVDHDWEMSFTSPAIGRNGVIYIGYEGKSDGTDYSRVYAVNPNGTLRWIYPVDDGRYVRASPAVGPDGRIYIATKASGENFPAKLIALSPGGHKVWDYLVERVHVTPDDSYSSPAIGADGLIYFGAETGYVYALNPNGTLNWKFQLQHGINWSSPAIVGDGTLYLGTWGGAYNQGCLYAIKTTSQGYAPAPWPRFRHDNKNNGRFGY
jgi:outer membrane protein assembly factor BamB